MRLRARLQNLKLGFLVTGSLLALAACGDDNPSNPTADRGTPDSTQRADGGVTPDSPPAGGSTIVDLAAKTADLSTLVAAVTRAGLVDTLKGAGPFTVFAPSNKAFADSGITDVSTIPVDQLKTILLYHVIAGRQVKAGDVKAGPVESAAALTFFLGTTGGVTLNGGNTVKGGAAVVTADVQASNGVVHLIDRVILPPDLPTAATYGGLGELVKAVGAAANLPDGTPVLKALQGAGPFTVFAPTDAAFKAITAPADAAKLRDVLLYHVVAGKTLSSAIPAKADTLLKNTWGNGVSLLFSTASGVKVNGAAVVLADIKTTNGVVHVVDKVLLPPTVVDLVGIAGLGELGKAVGAAAPLTGGTSVADALKAVEPYTVFAPTDAAFKAITAPGDANKLRDVLLLHVVKAAAPVLSAKLPTAPVDSLAGGKLTFSTSGPTVSSAGTSGAKIGPFDLNVTNGVVHVIDKVLLP